MIVNNGKLFWNESWISGVLLFDGSYTSFPIRYGKHTYEKQIQHKSNFLPLFSDLPDSLKTKSFFDYYRGDYLFDQIELGGDFESINENMTYLFETVQLYSENTQSFKKITNL